LPALNLADHRSLQEEIPPDQTLTILAEEPNEVQLKLLADGMENLVGVLGKCDEQSG
jgi:hypothetical protein